MLTLDGRRIAILRIPSFDERDYLSTCLARWENRRRYLRSRCDGQCLFGFVKEIRNQLLADLAARVRQVEAERAEVLLLDITQNPRGLRLVRAGCRHLRCERSQPRHAHAVLAVTRSFTRVFFCSFAIALRTAARPQGRFARAEMARERYPRTRSRNSRMDAMASRDRPVHLDEVLGSRVSSRSEHAVQALARLVNHDARRTRIRTRIRSTLITSSPSGRRPGPSSSRRMSSRISVQRLRWTDC